DPRLDASVVDDAESRLATTLERAVAASDAKQRYWLATRNAQSVEDGDAVEPGQSAAWGLGRVLALETSDAWGGIVDLPAEVDDDMMSLLADLLLESGVEDQFVVRKDGVR